MQGDDCLSRGGALGKGQVRDMWGQVVGRGKGWPTRVRVGE